MSILNKIEVVRASYKEGSFFMETSMDIKPGDRLAVLEFPQRSENYYEYITVSAFEEGRLDVVESLAGIKDGDEAVLGIVTPFKDPQSLQWDIAGLEGAAGRNQSGRYFRDVIAVKRTLSYSWGSA